MQPSQLTIESFLGYPPEARALAAGQLPLLREMPLSLVPILLRELIGYDWKLPAERRDLSRQFAYLHGLTAEQRTVAMADFRSLPLPADLAAEDWVHNPSGFIEQLTAWLWSTHQTERFRAMADAYGGAVDESAPVAQPSMPRLGMVAIGAGVEQTALPLFRKLRSAGVHFTGVLPEGGFAVLAAEAGRRATIAKAETQEHPSHTFDHWFIDGGNGGSEGDDGAMAGDGLTLVSYSRMEGARAKLLERIQKAIGSGGMGPEELRSLLARMKPEDVGLSETGAEGVLNHFQLSLMTEGSGTQIFATTFVQWAARECARRAQPETLLVRYAPRRQAEAMNVMLSGATTAGTDPQGSLVDADLGAYYTWLNMRRLSGSDQLRFLVWFEGHREALAIGPGLPGGTSSDSKMRLEQLVALLR